MKRQDKYVSESEKGTIREGNLSRMEYQEYYQTGMIRVKDESLSIAELLNLGYEHVNYYDWCQTKFANDTSYVKEEKKPFDLWDFIKL